MLEADLLNGDTDIRREVLSSTDVLLVGDMFYDEHIGSEVFDLCNTFKGLKRENEVCKQIQYKQIDKNVSRYMWGTLVGGLWRSTLISTAASYAVPSIPWGRQPETKTMDFHMDLFGALVISAEESIM